MRSLKSHRPDSANPQLIPAGEGVSNAKLCREFHDPVLNYFGVNASQPLSVRRKKGWIYHEDPRGWFQWSAGIIWAEGALMTNAR
jgi:hypothetical protein